MGFGLVNVAVLVVGCYCSDSENPVGGGSYRALKKSPAADGNPQGVG